MIDYNQNPNPDITAVVAVKGNVKLVKQFFKYFRCIFPNINLVVGALQAEPDLKQYLEQQLKISKNLKVAFGNPVDGHLVSFSENWNAAINLVETEKFVFIHTDMYVHREFFNELCEQLNSHGKGTFGIYTTVEPKKSINLTSITQDFGNSFDNFQWEKFEEFCVEYRQQDRKEDTPLAFYLSGFTEDLKDVGGFDFIRYVPAFCEDDDFLLRSKIKGYKSFYASHALVYHFGSKTSRANKLNGGISSEDELESNRRFCRKWGIESRSVSIFRNLRSCRLYNRTVAFFTDKNLPGRGISILEPAITYSTDIQNMTKEDLDWFDIVIIQKSGVDYVSSEMFNSLMSTISTIRVSKYYKAGMATLWNGALEVRIQDLKQGVLEDNTDYLSLQKEIEYE